jgi:NADPH:quinone reductase-like Zn-dependent oxidoreductase
LPALDTDGAHAIRGCQHEHSNAVAAVIGVVKSQGDNLEMPGTAKVKRKALPRKNAVVVFGATGRTGRYIVQTLLAEGRTVIAACRSASTAARVWKELGLQEGEQPDGRGLLFTEAGVDITNPRTLNKSVFAGATQVRMP